MASHVLDRSPPEGGDLIYRQRRSVRRWHWTNAFSAIVMLMSGLMIFNAYPQLYWCQYGADHEVPWLEIGSTGARGFLRIGPVTVPKTGVLGLAGGHPPTTSTSRGGKMRCAYRPGRGRIWP